MCVKRERERERESVWCVEEGRGSMRGKGQKVTKEEQEDPILGGKGGTGIYI